MAIAKRLNVVETEKCINCKFANTGVAAGYVVLQCHRYSPSWNGDTQSNWPIIASDDWCGEWQIDQKMRFSEIQEEKEKWK